MWLYDDHLQRNHQLGHLALSVASAGAVRAKAGVLALTRIGSSFRLFEFFRLIGCEMGRLMRTCLQMIWMKTEHIWPYGPLLDQPGSQSRPSDWSTRHRGSTRLSGKHAGRPQCNLAWSSIWWSKPWPHESWSKTENHPKDAKWQMIQSSKLCKVQNHRTEYKTDGERAWEMAWFQFWSVSEWQ